MWAEDAKIKRTELDIEALNIPILHSKYIKLMSSERVRFRALGEKKKILTQQLYDYYEGKLDGRDIGREPWQIVDKTKALTEKRVENDKELVDMNIRIFQSEEKVLLLKEIIININQRNFQLRVALDFMKFQNGQ